MKTGKARLYWSAVLTLAVASAAASSSMAYIDPGSGSYIFQLLIGAVVGSAVAVKVFWRRLVGFFASKASRKG